MPAECIYLDDFIEPEVLWRSRSMPAFPFDYIRYDEFLGAVKALACDGVCRYRLYDWSTARLRDDYRTVRLDKPVIVEGVSSLHPEQALLYDLRLWVESDATTTLRVSLRRGVGAWECEWRNLFLPSVELYEQTKPRERAEYRVAGRGAGE